jgi:hypothetical protein
MGHWANDEVYHAILALLAARPVRSWVQWEASHVDDCGCVSTGWATVRRQPPVEASASDVVALDGWVVSVRAEAESLPAGSRGGSFWPPELPSPAVL